LKTPTAFRAILGGRGGKELQVTLDVLKKVKDHLDRNESIRTLALTPEERETLKPYPLLTAKKCLYVANVSENDLPSMENEYVARVRALAQAEGNEVIAICAKLESEIAQLPKEERKEFLETLGLQESGLQRLVKASFKILDLITYPTTGEMETRAWTIKRGTKAPEAAGRIHTDIQKGFIRAEVVSYDDMVHCKGRAGARAAGKLRAEGRDYVVHDGDVMLFLHN